MPTITKSALIKRINRRLAHDDEMLRRSRGAIAEFKFGEYYIQDVRLNIITLKNVDVEGLGRELGVLREQESLSE